MIPVYNGDYPKCPVCKKETLLPLSAVYSTPGSKTLAHWVCVGCGFYVSTGRTAGYNIPNDIGMGMSYEIAKNFLICKETYEKAVKEGKIGASAPLGDVQSPHAPESEFGRALREERENKKKGYGER